jgi:hypothetical protein
MSDQFRFLITNMDNAAFEDDRNAEVARLLRETADRVETGALGGTLVDYNGNRVGDYGVRRDHENPLP